MDGVAGNCLKLLEMAGNGWIWQEWLEVAKSVRDGWKWLEWAGNDWKWLEIA